MLRKIFFVCLIAMLASGFVMAQEQKDTAQSNDVQEPNFRLGGMGICWGQGPVDIPDNLPDSGVTTTLDIPCPEGTVTDLEVLVQISHTWVGDLEVTLTKVAGPSAIILDRPGLAPPEPPPGSCCGCGSNDVDVIFSDAGDHDAESECLAGPPAITGLAVAGDPANNTLMASFNGEDLCGSWTLRVTDGAGADTGSLDEWCLINGGGDDGPPVPASNRTAIFVLGSLLLLGSTYYMIRRRQTV